MTNLQIGITVFWSTLYLFWSWISILDIIDLWKENSIKLIPSTGLWVVSVFILLIVLSIYFW